MIRASSYIVIVHAHANHEDEDGDAGGVRHC